MEFVEFKFLIDVLLSDVYSGAGGKSSVIS